MTPVIWTPIVRVRGPSISARIIDCHVPVLSSPLLTGTDSLDPKSMVSKWLWQLTGSWARHASSPPGQLGGPFLKCKSLWRYGYSGGASFSSHCRISSTSLPSISLTVIAVVVCRLITVIVPSEQPDSLSSALSCGVRSDRAMPFFVSTLISTYLYTNSPPIARHDAPLLLLLTAVLAKDRAKALTCCDAQSKQSNKTTTWLSISGCRS